MPPRAGRPLCSASAALGLRWRRWSCAHARSLDVGEPPRAVTFISRFRSVVLADAKALRRTCRRVAVAGPQSSRHLILADIVGVLTRRRRSQAAGRCHACIERDRAPPVLLTRVTVGAKFLHLVGVARHAVGAPARRRRPPEVERRRGEHVRFRRHDRAPASVDDCSFARRRLQRRSICAWRCGVGAWDACTTLLPSRPPSLAARILAPAVSDGARRRGRGAGSSR